jgi:hypothetical protein
MNTLKTYAVDNPLKPKNKTNENQRSTMSKEEIQHKLKLIEKAFK